MDKNEEKAYEDGFVAGMQHDAESRVSKFIDASMREWVGLKEEEVNSIYAGVEKVVGEHWENGGTKLMFPFTLYEAIEAKLKEKNG